MSQWILGDWSVLLLPSSCLHSFLRLDTKTKYKSNVFQCYFPRICTKVQYYESCPPGYHTSVMFPLIPKHPVTGPCMVMPAVSLRCKPYWKAQFLLLYVDQMQYISLSHHGLIPLRYSCKARSLKIFKNPTLLFEVLVSAPRCMRHMCIVARVFDVLQMLRRPHGA